MRPLFSVQLLVSFFCHIKYAIKQVPAHWTAIYIATCFWILYSILHPSPNFEEQRNVGLCSILHESSNFAENFHVAFPRSNLFLILHFQGMIKT